MKDRTDLDSADWLCFFTETIIKKVNPSIIVNISIQKNDDGITIKRLIYVSNISEEDILKLKFLTNTNDNNNYLYLEKFIVDLDNGNTKLRIHGLNDIILNFWRYSDSNAFEKDEKFFYPFSSIVNINKFIDDYTNLITIFPKTSNKPKIYSLVLNPDCPTSLCGVTGDTCNFYEQGCCCGYDCQYGCTWEH